MFEYASRVEFNTISVQALFKLIVNDFSKLRVPNFSSHGSNCTTFRY